MASSPSSRKPTFRKPATLIPIVVSLLLLGWVLASSPNFGQHSNEVGSPIAGDFLQEWIGAYTIRHHGSMSLFDHEHLKGLQHDEGLLGFRWTENQYFAMVYPPFYYWLWVPFTWVPYPVAAWIFIGLMIGCFVLAHQLMVRAIRNDSSTNPSIGNGLTWAPWLLVPATIYVPLIRSITTGQKGTLCLLILVAAYLLYTRSKRFSSGVTFGLMAFKPQLAIVIGLAMLVRRKWAFVFGSLSVVSMAVGVCFAMGFDVCQEYTDFTLGAGEYIETSGYDLYKSHCLMGFFALLGGGESTLATKCCWAVSAAVITILLAKMFRDTRTLEDGIRHPIQFSAMLLATMLLTPHLFSYDLTILLLPMYLMTGMIANQRFPRPQATKLAVLLVILFVASGFSHIIAAKFGLQITTILMAGWFGFITYSKPWQKCRATAHSLTAQTSLFAKTGAGPVS